MDKGSAVAKALFAGAVRSAAAAGLKVVKGTALSLALERGAAAGLSVVVDADDDETRGRVVPLIADDEGLAATEGGAGLSVVI